MLVHTAQVRGRKIAWDKREVVQHGLNADRIKFDLDAEFRCCDSYQVVLCGPSLESPKRYIPDKDMTVAVPPSLMESTGPVSTCLLGYVGGEVRVVTAQERYPLVVVESGFTGPLDPGEEQPDLWAQIMSAEAARIEAELVREAAETARADAEAKRIAAEKARETAEAGRVEAEKVRVTADAERGRRVDASVKKADAATAEATEAAGKATASATEADAAAKRADEAAKGASENVLVGTETATVVHVEDAWPTLLRECKVLGKSEQTVTTGKNLFSTFPKKMIDSEIVEVHPDGMQLEAGTYTASFVTTVGNLGSVYARDRADGSQIAVNTNKTFVTFTLDAAKSVYFRLYRSGGLKVEQVVAGQLEKGATATAYEPYTGGKPSPRHDFPQPITSVGKAEVVTAGKNLLDPTPRDALPYTTNGITYSDAGNGMVRVQGTATETAFLNLKRSPMLKGGCTYVLSQTNKSVNFSIEGFSSPGVPTRVDKDTSYGAAYFYVLKGIQVDAIVGVQLEVGSAATTYAPHVPLVSTAIDLQGHELRSLPNGVRDEVVVDREGNVSLVKRVGAFDLSTAGKLEFLPVYGASKNVFRTLVPDAIVVAVSSSATHMRCDKLMPQTAYYVYKNQSSDYVFGFDVFSHTKPYVSWGIDGVDTEDAMRAWLAENKPTVLYKLAEPQTVPLGKVSVPALPESTSNVWNADAITTDVSATYVRDVNIAFSKLESKLTQAVVAAAANL